MSNLILSILFMLIGTLSVLAAIANWEWFFATDNAAFIVRYLKRTGARLLYGFVGLMLWGIAIYLLCDYLK